MLERPAIRISSSLFKLGTRSTYRVTYRLSRRSNPLQSRASYLLTPAAPRTFRENAHRTFHSTPAALLDILSDASDKDAGKESEPHQEVTRSTPITEEEFHQKADKFFEDLVTQLESMQEEKDKLDVEYSVGLHQLFGPQSWILALAVMLWLVVL